MFGSRVLEGPRGQDEYVLNSGSSESMAKFPIDVPGTLTVRLQNP